MRPTAASCSTDGILHCALSLALSAPAIALSTSPRPSGASSTMHAAYLKCCRHACRGAATEAPAGPLAARHAFWSQCLSSTRPTLPAPTLLTAWVSRPCTCRGLLLAVVWLALRTSGSSALRQRKHSIGLGFITGVSLIFACCGDVEAEPKPRVIELNALFIGFSHLGGVVPREAQARWLLAALWYRLTSEPA